MAWSDAARAAAKEARRMRKAGAPRMLAVRTKGGFREVIKTYPKVGAKPRVSYLGGTVHKTRAEAMRVAEKRLYGHLPGFRY